jgi:hypothetical protein
VVGHAEGHHRTNTRARIALDLAGQLRLGNAVDARHTVDRHEIVDFLFHENRQHQVIQAELGLLEHRP